MNNNTINDLIGILRGELQKMNISQSVLFDKDWWDDDDMEKFLIHLKKRFAECTKDDGGKK